MSNEISTHVLSRNEQRESAVLRRKLLRIGAGIAWGVTTLSFSGCGGGSSDDGAGGGTTASPTTTGFPGTTGAPGTTTTEAPAVCASGSRNFPVAGSQATQYIVPSACSKITVFAYGAGGAGGGGSDKSGGAGGKRGKRDTKTYNIGPVALVRPGDVLEIWVARGGDGGGGLTGNKRTGGSGGAGGHGL